jgi:hypothetical protein
MPKSSRKPLMIVAVPRHLQVLIFNISNKLNYTLYYHIVGQTGKANANHPNRIAARQSMYGDFLPKLDLLENSIQDGFQQEMHKKGATQTWPNISMRL